MRVQTLALVWPETLMHSHALSLTLNVLKFSMRVDDSFLSFVVNLDFRQASNGSNASLARIDVPCRILPGAETFLCLDKSGLRLEGMEDCLGKGFLAATLGRNGDVPEN